MAGTAAHPIRLVIKRTHLVQIESNWPLNESGADYHLDFEKDFKTVPEHGDVTGLVGAIVGLARCKNSGVKKIYVQSHTILEEASAVISTDELKELLRSAALRAGLGAPELR